jgi:cytidylate kinase
LGKKELIHERDIIIRCFETDEGRLIVEGTLTDERFFPFMFYTTKEYHNPSVVHKMVVSLTLSIPKLEVLSVDVEMPITPMKECAEIISSLQKLKGISIASGFAGTVRKLFGKTEGCLHLNNLILSMGSAAMQGLWSYFSRVREGRVAEPKTDQSLILDSCWLWRKDGPIADRYRELQRGKKAESETPHGMIVTIDGPAGAGKSTVSRALAARLGYLYLDTGAIYRAVAYAVRRRGIQPEESEALGRLLNNVRIELKNGDNGLCVIIDDEDVTAHIRTEEISLLASKISAVPAVRQSLLHVQREAAAKGAVVAEGRDMGTVVFPRADFKFYLDASADERASRRYKELRERTDDADFDRVKKDLDTRDRQDSERETAPLRPPEDAVVIDSSSLTADEVVEAIIAVINGPRKTA